MGPYYLDILNGQNFAKKGQKLSMKPMDFSCVLRLSKSQMNENGFKDATVEQVYSGLLESLAFSSYKICFPRAGSTCISTVKRIFEKIQNPKLHQKLKKMPNLCKKRDRK